MAEGLSGIGTGMDWGSLIEKTLAKARKPAEQWEKQVKTLELKKEIFDKVSSLFFKMRMPLTQLKLESTYLAKQAELTSMTAGQDAAGIVKVTPKSEAAVSQWKIKINQLATYQTYTGKRQKSVADALNLEGKFKVFVGQQMAEISIEKEDSLREINLKLGKLKDQFGQPMALESMLLDNHLVIKSARSGLDKVDQKTMEKLTISGDKVTFLPRTNTPGYPNQILSVFEGQNQYKEGIDYTYNKSKGIIQWVDGKKPTEGTEVSVIYSDQVKVKADGSATTMIPPLLSGEELKSGTPITIKKPDGTIYDTSEYTVDTSSGTNNGKIIWSGTPPANDSELIITIGDVTAYGTDYNKLYLAAENGSTILKDLGIDTPSLEAQDAKLSVNGVDITRSENKIDDIIGNSTLELIGTGEVLVNITQDAQKAIEGVNSFIESYNETMNLINALLEEKKESTTGKDKDTVFGLFHGDSLLWSLKSQIRNFIMDPVKQLSPSIATKKFSNTSAPLAMEGSFYVTTDGKRSRIDIQKGDSLQDIQKSILAAHNQLTKDGSNAGKDSMPLSVSIKNGQLIIDSTSSKVGLQTHSESIKRGKDRNYDYLPFIYESSSPINGKISVSTRSKTYQEGVDYDIVTVESDKNDIIESRIVWKTQNKPGEDEQYSVTHTYMQSSVAVKIISGNLGSLGFYADSTASSISKIGINSESANKGKSGLLQFDSKKMMDAMKENPKSLSTLMTTFMRDMDAFIGNVVDSSNNIVAGETVIKGRIPSKVKAIDQDITGLNKQIKTLDKRLKDRQESLYKRYTEMEKSMSKINAQLASLQQFVSKMAPSKN